MTEKFFLLNPLCYNGKRGLCPLKKRAPPVASVCVRYACGPRGLSVIANQSAYEQDS